MTGFMDNTKDRIDQRKTIGTKFSTMVLKDRRPDARKAFKADLGRLVEGVKLMRDASHTLQAKDRHQLESESAAVFKGGEAINQKLNFAVAQFSSLGAKVNRALHGVTDSPNLVFLPTELDANLTEDLKLLGSNLS